MMETVALVLIVGAVCTLLGHAAGYAKGREVRGRMGVGEDD